MVVLILVARLLGFLFLWSLTWLVCLFAAPFRSPTRSSVVVGE